MYTQCQGGHNKLLLIYLVMGIVELLIEGMLSFTVSIEVTALYAVDSRFFMGTYAKEGTS
jgi:hypothetical protein